ncbi:hypothetical protein HNQ44_003013 [Planomicrobium koreense]|uniref:Uncharacterized protein n=1 Tax=Planococcus koreensis TaxID=112331 RepID=A0A7W8CW36_9BACL|nr:hypothetical protein [Planococcus koreensis]MBB5181548.1 hypothetical protein [Planococcus koreensis]
MLEKQEGKINEIVYDHTAYRGGKYRLYPTIDGLKELLGELIEADATTEYLRINPFYVNEKVNLQREFGRFMFFLECRESYTEEDEVAAIIENLEGEESLTPVVDWEKGKALYPLCRFDDPERFAQALKNFWAYLDIGIPQMLAMAKEDLNLKEDDLGFGYFCFEIESE